MSQIGVGEFTSKLGLPEPEKVCQTPTRRLCVFGGPVDVRPPSGRSPTHVQGGQINELKMEVNEFNNLHFRVIDFVKLDFQVSSGR